MDYDFTIGQDSLRVPATEYRPIKRCQFCQSVFLNEKACEACGRSLHYHLIGEPFGAKSFYGIKERYVESLDILNRFFPIFENKKSPLAKSYLRKLEKRFLDLVSAFNSEGVIVNENRKLYYVESIELINELLRYDVNPALLQSLLFDNDSSLVGQDLLLYLAGNDTVNKAEQPWIESFFGYRPWNIFRVDSWLKILVTTAAVLTLAVAYKDIISSQFGK